MIGTATIRQLVSYGLSPEQLLAVAEAIDADAAASAPATDHAAERRRAYDRARKRKIPPENSTGNSAEISPYEDTSTPLVPSPSGDGAVGEIEVSAEANLWASGKAMLARLGVPKSQTGSVIGKWKKAHGVGETIEALATADRESRMNGGLVDPIAFVEGVFRHKAEPDRPPC